jgi:DNA repair protein RadD
MSRDFPDPRPFQALAHDKLRAGRAAGHRCQMLMAPTGAGKTYLGLRVISEALKKARRGIFVCDRTTLILQTSETADRYGLDYHNIIQADHWRRNAAPFSIASAQTLARRNWPDADVIVIDEAHTQLKTWVDHIQKTEATVIGLSATPFSSGLGKLFTNIVNAATMAELVEQGILTPLRVLSCTPTDMKGAATKGGEWTEDAAGERGMKIVGDVVAEWIKYADNRKTIVFGSNIKHCEELCRSFREAGIAAALFTSHTGAEERKALLEDYREADSTLRVLISVEALAKGFDVPDVSCVVDCRPLRKSLSTAIQMWGRGMRCSPETGKEDCLLLDHSGNIIRFSEDFERIYHAGLDKLDDGQILDKRIRRDEDEESQVKACPACGYKPFRKRCMACGHERKSQALVEAAPGEMREIRIGKTKYADDARHLWDQVVSYCKDRGNPDTLYGRAFHTYKDIAGVAPPKHFTLDRAQDVAISRPVLNKIRARNIQFFKAREKQSRMQEQPA